MFCAFLPNRLLENLVIEVDFHCHSFFSQCGIHTALELISRAHELGLKGLAITDHGPDLEGRVNSPFFERFRCPTPHLRLLKGMECNIRNEGGDIDLPPEFLKWMDVVLVGFHGTVAQAKDASYYTDLMIRTMRTNPCIDIITHPNDLGYPVDFEELASAARTEGVALELNNSKTALKRCDNETTLRLLRACKKTGCRIAICSDAHAINEVGNDEAVRPLLLQVGIPHEQIVNKNADSAFAFIEQRRERKTPPQS